MSLRDFKAIEERRLFIGKETNSSLSSISVFADKLKEASLTNCENMIGAVSVPLGVAGPLKIQNPKSQIPKKEEYYIPLATTEGALVASVNRGCKAITESGGAMTDSHKVGVTRGPVFQVKNLYENKHLYEFLKHNLSEFKKIAEATSHHLILKKVESRGIGHYRFVRFIFDTQDAMGMNMVTIATEQVVRFIEKKTGTVCVSVAGNFDIDKKPAWLNFVENRGIKAWAEITIPEMVLQNVLKTTAKKIYDVWLAKCMLGSAMSGSMGFNAQFANVIAAIFLATGQDPGHISEGSMGITTTEVVNGNNLYMSVYLPDLMVGTVGGGTGLPTQKEALSILRVNNSQEFAEILSAAVLAGEISLLASLAEGSLAKAHKKLGRNKTQ